MDSLTMNAEVVEMQIRINQVETSEAARLAQSSILSELPGLAFALTTLVYIVASLVMA